MADWNNFFLGELGAAAALAGLLFVAVTTVRWPPSINAWVLLIEINR